MASQGKRWRPDSPAAKVLREMLDNQEITESDTPREVYLSRPEFREYRLETFRAALSRMRGISGKGEQYLVNLFTNI